MLALIDMGVTPLYLHRRKIQQPSGTACGRTAGKVIYHFESVDMAQAKKILGNTACISGNLPIYLLEYGTKQQVIDACKSLIDTCAPGGGYIFDTNGSIDNAKRENIEAMYDTVLNYGRK